MALEPEQVGKRIEEARKARGMTHQQFAEAMGVYMRTVQRWQKGRDPKTGKSWLPRLATLMEIAEFFDLPKSYFVETEDTQAQMRDLAGQVEALRDELADLREKAGVTPPTPDELARRRAARG